MSAVLRVKCLIAGFCFIVSLQVFADETKLVSSSPSTEAALWSPVDAYFQTLAQIHATQQIIESNQLKTAAVLASNADAMTARIQVLEQTIADQRASDAESARKTRQTTLTLAGIGMLGLVAVLAIVYFQLRAATRLVELAMSSPAFALNHRRPLPTVETGGELPASARGAVEFSNARLFGVVERLEKRILELEQDLRASLIENNGSGHGEAHSSGNGSQHVMDLVAEGQLFLDANEPEKALKNFDEALAIEPEKIETLVKKAGALEKLNRIDEAIACYDLAIAADDSTTIAYLHKGGLFNRLARYDEALQCYERALKNSARENAAP